MNGDSSEDFLVTHLPHFLFNMTEAQDNVDDTVQITFSCGDDTYGVTTNEIFYTFQTDTLTFKLQALGGLPPGFACTDASSSLSATFNDQPASFHVNDKQYYSKQTEIPLSKWEASECINHQGGMRTQQLVVQGDLMVYIMSEVRCQQCETKYKFVSTKCIADAGTQVGSLDFALVNRQPSTLSWDCIPEYVDHTGIAEYRQWQGQWVLPNPDGKNATWIRYNGGDNHRVHYGEEELSN